MTFKFFGKKYQVIEGGRLWWAIELLPALAITAVAVLALYLWTGIGAGLE